MVIMEHWNFKELLDLRGHMVFLNPPPTRFYPAALKGSGVLSYPERAGGRQGRQTPLTLSRP